MISVPSDHDSEIWRRLDEALHARAVAWRELFAEGVDRVALVRKALSDGRGKYTACEVIPRLSTEELKALFDVLVDWSSTAHGTIQVFRDAILSLPREWVLARIEQAAEPLLAGGTYDEYRRFLELYDLLDRDLTLRLARRAAASEDEDIREAGEDFLAPLGEAPAAGVEGVPRESA